MVHNIQNIEKKKNPKLNLQSPSHSSSSRSSHTALCYLPHSPLIQFPLSPPLRNSRLQMPNYTMMSFSPTLTFLESFNRKSRAFLLHSNSINPKNLAWNKVRNSWMRKKYKKICFLVMTQSTREGLKEII